MGSLGLPEWRSFRWPTELYAVCSLCADVFFKCTQMFLRFPDIVVESRTSDVGLSSIQGHCLLICVEQVTSPK